MKVPLIPHDILEASYTYGLIEQYTDALQFDATVLGKLSDGAHLFLSLSPHLSFPIYLFLSRSISLHGG